MENPFSSCPAARVNADVIRTAQASGKRVTRDQSLVQLLVDQGALFPEDARAAKRKNILLRAIESSNEVEVAIGRLKLRRGDRFLLCPAP